MAASSSTADAMPRSEISRHRFFHNGHYYTDSSQDKHLQRHLTHIPPALTMASSSTADAMPHSGISSAAGAIDSSFDNFDVTDSFEADLMTRLEDLPRELYELVQHFAILKLVESGPTVCDLTTPRERDRYEAEVKILQLNRTTRKQYSKIFYQRRAFSVSSDWRYLSTFYETRSKEHQAFIGGILYDFSSLISATRARFDLGDVLVSLKRQAEDLYGAKFAGKVKVRFEIDLTGED